MSESQNSNKVSVLEIVLDTCKQAINVYFRNGRFSMGLKFAKNQYDDKN